jgi:glycosyltransferase involved in cell wall biosynthesis
MNESPVRLRQATPVAAAASPPQPFRVLHVVGTMARGGVETWLMHVFRNSPAGELSHEILATKQTAGFYDDECRARGVSIHRLPIGWNKLAWLIGFVRFLRRTGPYDAVHSHLYLFSGLVLLAARLAGVRIRVAHCHNAHQVNAAPAPWPRRLYRRVMVRLIGMSATSRLGISDAAIEEIAGRDWRRRRSARVLLYGFDFGRFQGATPKSPDLRARLGLPGDALVVGHVGRFIPVKNHAMLVKAFAIVVQARPNARLVLVGDGETRPSIEAMVAAEGISHRVLFAGETQDVPDHMAMFDVFLLPSLSEGLGIVCLEAQAAGTPLVVSAGGPREVDVVPGAVLRMPADASALEWSEAALAQAARPRSQPEWFQMVVGSRFGIGRCVSELTAIYRSGIYV